MAKEPKANWSLYTKAELVKMIKNYDKRQAVLLNRIAKLEATHPNYINEASLERALVEVKHPSEQKGFKVAGAVTDRLPPVPPYASTCDWQNANQDKVTDGTLFPWQAVLDATKDYS